jgi:hypothetical protein
MFRKILFLLFLGLTALPAAGEDLILRPSVLKPIGDFSVMAGTGYGFFASIDSIYDKKYRLGITAGYSYFPGEYKSETGMQEIENFYIIPVMIKAAYIFNVTRKIAITPTAECGIARVNMNYITRSASTGLLTEKASSGFDPIAVFNLNLDYNITRNVFTGINGGYGVIYEEKGDLGFILAGLTIGMRF